MKDEASMTPDPCERMSLASCFRSEAAFRKFTDAIRKICVRYIGRKAVGVIRDGLEMEMTGTARVMFDRGEATERIRAHVESSSDPNAFDVWWSLDDMMRLMVEALVQE